MMLVISADDYSRNLTEELPQENPCPECGVRQCPRSRHPHDAPWRHFPPLHHLGPLPLHGVAAPGFQVYVHH